MIRPAWLKKYTRGIEGGENWTCVYEGRTEAIITVPGRKFWSEVRLQEYTPTEHRVVNKFAYATNDRTSQTFSTGRLTIPGLTQAIREIQAREAGTIVTVKSEALLFRLMHLVPDFEEAMKRLLALTEQYDNDPDEETSAAMEHAQFEVSQRLIEIAQGEQP